MCRSSVVILEKLLQKHYGETNEKGIKKVTADSILNPFSPNEGASVYEFFRLLAVCNTVKVDTDPNTKELTYQASSPDELALLQGAKQVEMVL